MYRHCVPQIYIVWMVTDCLTERMGSVPNLPIKRSISIGRMVNFDGDGHGDGNGDGTCKQALKSLLAFFGISAYWCAANKLTCNFKL